MISTDSVHSTIESYIRRRTIWVPSEWLTTIHNARTNSTGFENWKSLTNLLLPSRVFYYQQICNRFVNDFQFSNSMCPILIRIYRKVDNDLKNQCKKKIE